MISNHGPTVVSLRKLRTGVSIATIVPGPSAAHHVLKFASNFLPRVNSARTLRHRITGELNVQALHLDRIWDELGPKVYRRFLEIRESYDDKESGVDLPTAVQLVCKAFHPKLFLVKHFRPFLHDGDDFNLAEDYDDTRCIVITSRGVSTMRAAFGPSVTRWDNAKITALLKRAVDVPEYRIAVTTLCGPVAHRAMELMQRFIDDAEPFNTEQGGNSRDLAALLVELSHRSNLIPTYLYLSTSTPDHQTKRAGAFSVVYRSRHKRNPVAYKRLTGTRLQSELYSDTKDVTEKLGRHAVSWRQLQHPNIVPFLGLSAGHFEGQPCIITPWYERGTIINYLNGKNEKVSSEKLNLLLLEVARGINYLHSKGIVHGAIRGGNILVDDEGRARLADYELTVFRDTSKVNYSIGGVNAWEAPELIRPSLFGTSGHPTYETDVYAFACLCIELYTRKRPFDSLDEEEVPEVIVNGQRPERPSDPMMTDSVWALVQSCWAQEVSARPTVPSVVSSLEEINSTR